jgi:hypothetical protein
MDCPGPIVISKCSVARCKRCLLTCTRPYTAAESGRLVRRLQECGKYRTYSLHIHSVMEVVHNAVDTRLEIRPSTEVSIEQLQDATVGTHVLSISSRSGVAGKFIPRACAVTIVVECDEIQHHFSGSECGGRCWVEEGQECLQMLRLMVSLLVTDGLHAKLPPSV